MKKQKKTSEANQGLESISLTQTFFSEIKKVTGLTHEEIAKQLDPLGEYALTSNDISQYITGKKNISQKRLLKLAQQTKVVPGWDIPIVERMLRVEVDSFGQHIQLSPDESSKLNYGD